MISDGSSDPFSVTEKHVLVVGAGSGIGATVATSFARSGASVAIAGRDLDRLTAVAKSEQWRGSPAQITGVDVREHDSVENMFREVTSRAPLDIVVVCAGMSKRSEIVDMDESDFDQVISTKLTGTFNCAKHAGRHFIPRKSGKLILFASLTSHFGLKYGGAYSASKGGVVQLAKSLAVEWAEHNIQVNAVAPGFVETEMTKVSLSMPERRKWVLDRTPAKRFGTPQEIANAVHFLASPASDFITGHVLYVDGGFMAGSQW